MKQVHATPFTKNVSERTRPHCATSTGFRVHENAAPLKHPAHIVSVTALDRFRVHENAAPLKRRFYTLAESTEKSVSAFMRTRPH